MAKKKSVGVVTVEAPVVLAEAPAAAEKSLKLTKTQGFVIERWKRSDIKNAPYNPRVIAPEARKRLMANLGKFGHMAPITVNRKTGNLVGGHQRLAATDAIEGSKDYLLDVAVVELSVADEKNQNIFLNNTAAQGEWDLGALTELLKDTDVDYTVAGFSNVDLEVLLDNTEFLDDLPIITKEPLLAGGLQDGLDGLNEIAASKDKAKAQAKEVKAALKDATLSPPPGASGYPKPPKLHGDDEEASDDDSGEERPARSGSIADGDVKEGNGVAVGNVIDPAAAEAQRILDIKAAKKKGREQAVEDNDTETFVVVTYSSREEAQRMQERFGGDAAQRFIDGRLVDAMLDELDALHAKYGTLADSLTQEPGAKEVESVA